MGGLHALTRAGDGFIVHPNLAGPPPGYAPEDGRATVVKKDEEKTHDEPEGENRHRKSP